MTDPTCEKNMDQGGCKGRRCDKALTPSDKVCSSTSAGLAACTLAECQMKCANASKAAYGGIVESCDHFAYDTTDKDCYVFNGCADEGFSDDYNLYNLEYPTKAGAYTRSHFCSN